MVPSNVSECCEFSAILLKSFGLFVELEDDEDDDEIEEEQDERALIGETDERLKLAFISFSLLLLLSGVELHDDEEGEEDKFDN